MSSGHRYPRGQRGRWHITIAQGIAAGGAILFVSECADRKEAACLATEARSRSSSVQIWIRDPYGASDPWD